MSFVAQSMSIPQISYANFILLDSVTAIIRAFDRKILGSIPSLAHLRAASGFILQGWSWREGSGP